MAVQALEHFEADAFVERFFVDDVVTMIPGDLVAIGIRWELLVAHLIF